MSDVGQRPSSASSNSPPLRSKKSRTKSGCLTCRIRRVKCDEAKPDCNRCTSTGRKCDGYGPEPLSRQGLMVAVANRTQSRSPSRIRGISSLPTPGSLVKGSIFEDESERRYFDIFRQHTGPTTGGIFNLDGFWDGVLLQVSQAEPAIKHGVLALGALHKHCEIDQETAGSRPELFGDEAQDHAAHYGKAVAHTRKLLTNVEEARDRDQSVHDRNIAFMACVIFVCYENIAGNVDAAMTHLRSGLQIFAESELENRISSGESPKRNAVGSTDAQSVGTAGVTASGSENRPIASAISPVETTISRLLRRLDLQAMTISDTQAPYVYPELSPITVLESQEPPPIPPDFAHGGMTDASSHLIEQMRWLLKVCGVLQGLSGVAEEEPQETEGRDPGISRQDTKQEELPGYDRPDGSELQYAVSLLGRCEQRLHEWDAAFKRTRSQQSPSEYSREHRTATILQLYHINSLLILHCGCTGQEISWDPRVNDIRDAVGLAETLVGPTSRTTDPTITVNDEPGISQSQHAGNATICLSLEIGVIFPLCLLGLKCRDPTVRRRIITLLSTPPRRREGRWDSFGAAAVIRRTMEIEEEEAKKLKLKTRHSGLESSGVGVSDVYVGTAMDIPEQARVYAVYPAVNMTERKIEAKFVLKPDSENWVIKKELLRF